MRDIYTTNPRQGDYHEYTNEQTELESGGDNSITDDPFVNSPIAENPHTQDEPMLDDTMNNENDTTTNETSLEHAELLTGFVRILKGFEDNEEEEEDDPDFDPHDEDNDSSPYDDLPPLLPRELIDDDDSEEDSDYELDDEDDDDESSSFDDLPPLESRELDNDDSEDEDDEKVVQPAVQQVHIENLPLDNLNDIDNNDYSPPKTTMAFESDENNDNHAPPRSKTFIYQFTAQQTTTNTIPSVYQETVHCYPSCKSQKNSGWRTICLQKSNNGPRMQF